MRVGVVDIGSNSTRLLVADVEHGWVTAEHVRRSEVTRLGAGVDATGRLREDAMQRVFARLDEYRRALDEHRCERCAAVLTSAVRDAANGREFAAEVGRRYRLEARVLEGGEEARLTFLGAASERHPEAPAPVLVVDVGGGSTELVFGRRGEVLDHASTQAGVVRQTERHLHDDPPTHEQLAELSIDVRDVIERAMPADERRAAAACIAVAGTATSLAAIHQRLEPYDPARVHGYVLGLDDCERVLERLIPLPVAERRRVAGLHPDRAPTIVAGVVILVEVLRAFGLDRVEVSEHDILRGAALACCQAA